MIDPTMLHLKLYMIRKEKELIKEERTFRRTSVRTESVQSLYYRHKTEGGN